MCKSVAANNFIPKLDRFQAADLYSDTVLNFGLVETESKDK